MSTTQARAKTIDAFIAGYPENVRAKLGKVRAAIRKAAPDAEEKISYGIPTFSLHGPLVHFSAYAKHIGFYPGPGAIRTFAGELTDFECSKGAVRFPLDGRVPLGLIGRIVKFRLRENLARAKKPRPRR